MTYGELRLTKSKSVICILKQKMHKETICLWKSKGENDADEKSGHAYILRIENKWNKMNKEVDKYKGK